MKSKGNNIVVEAALIQYFTLLISSIKQDAVVAKGARHVMR